MWNFKHSFQVNLKFKRKNSLQDTDYHTRLHRFKIHTGTKDELLSTKQSKWNCSSWGSRGPGSLGEPGSREWASLFYHIQINKLFYDLSLLSKNQSTELRHNSFDWFLNYAFSEKKFRGDSKSAYKVSRKLLISLYLEGKLSYVQKKPLKITPYNSGAATAGVLKKGVLKNSCSETFQVKFPVTKLPGEICQLQVKLVLLEFLIFRSSQR